MNAQVSSLDEARPAETGNLPPITERPTRPVGGTQVRKKKRGRTLLLALAVISVVLAGYTMVKGRLAQGGFGLRAEQDIAKPDPMKLLQDKVASLESTLNGIESGYKQFSDAVASDLAGMRNSIAAVASVEDLAALRSHVDQMQSTVASYSGRVSSLENLDKQRRMAALERVQQQQQQETRAREEEVTLPFRVLALDRWGGKPYLTVAPPGVNVLETMGVGDKRAGWELKDVDARGGNVTFVDQNGHSITKTVEER